MNAAADPALLSGRPRRFAPERIAETLSRVRYRLVETSQDRDEIYRLRYRAYLQEGAISPNESGTVKDEFDDLPNTWIFGIYYDDRLSSSLRVSVATEETSRAPSVHVFGDLLEGHLQSGKVIVDPTRFVADPDDGRRIALLPYLTIRLGYMAAEYFNADYGLATVRSEHLAFYERTFMHKQVSGPREYLGLVKPLHLMVSDFKTDKDKILARYPIFESSESERAALFISRAADVEEFRRR